MGTLILAVVTLPGWWWAPLPTSLELNWFNGTASEKVVVTSTFADRATLKGYSANGTAWLVWWDATQAWVYRGDTPALAATGARYGSAVFAGAQIAHLMNPDWDWTEVDVAWVPLLNGFILGFTLDIITMAISGLLLGIRH